MMVNLYLEVIYLLFLKDFPSERNNKRVASESTARQKEYSTVQYSNFLTPLLQNGNKYELYGTVAQTRH